MYFHLLDHLKNLMTTSPTSLNISVDPKPGPCSTAQRRLWSLSAGDYSLLRQRGIILSCISNFDSRLFGILDGLGIASQFDSVLISSQVGHAKPDPGIFQVALTRHEVSPEEVLFVGDTPEADVAGAEGAGIKGVLLDPKARQQSDFTCITNLKEVLSLIDR